MIRNFSWLLNLLVLDVVLAIGENCRNFESHILLSFKIGYEANCKFDINFKEVFQIN